MKYLSQTLACVLMLSTTLYHPVLAHSSNKETKPKLQVSKVLDNQTTTVSTVQSQSGLPFSISIQQANFQLPVGFHSGVVGVYQGKWIFTAGRTNGLHGFDPTNNFPADKQNTTIYVVDPTNGSVKSRSLSDSSSGLTQQQIDTLSVTSPQGYQEGNTLYMSGGYGVNTATGNFETKAYLTAINLPGIYNWVTSGTGSVATNIKQIYDSTFQISGGEMYKVGDVTQLVFGQDFEGQYTDSSNGTYSKQIRLFKIKNNNGQLAVDIFNSKPSTPLPDYRRRDLNVLPTLLNVNNKLQYGLIAYAGVFTLTSGVWTVPVVIDSSGNPTEADPNASTTFKQAMNQYVTAAVGLYSRKNTSMYHILFGGMSYGFFSNGVFQTDSEVPFINQVTTIQMDKNGNFTQYLMNNQYPTIASTGSNPGNTLLFGAGAYFIPTSVEQYPNGVISLDGIRKSTVIGYIVGGIMSTLANTNVNSDSAASPYIFTVTLTPNSSFVPAPRSLSTTAAVHANKQALQVVPHVENLMQKNIHKYHESSSPPTPQSHHSA